MITLTICTSLTLIALLCYLTLVTGSIKIALFSLVMIGGCLLDLVIQLCLSLGDLIGWVRRRFMRKEFDKRLKGLQEYDISEW